LANRKTQQIARKWPLGGRGGSARPSFCHVIRGRRYRVVEGASLRGDWGRASNPKLKGAEIRIAKGLTGIHELDTIIHEAIHAALWDLDEDAVSETSSSIAGLLWKMGFRRCGEKTGHRRCEEKTGHRRCEEQQVPRGTDG
jgi:hypothetical protein